MSPSPAVTIPAMIKRIVPAIATRGRVLTMIGFGLLPVIVAFFINRANDNDGVDDFVPAELLSRFSLLIFIPLVVLIFASATLGTLREERTLVYFWLRPIGRWQIAVASFISGLLVLIPVIALPTLFLAAVIGDAGDMAGILVAAFIAIVAYGALFTFLGLVTQRALIWGLIYIIVWEGFLGGLSRGAGRLSIRNYTRSALSRVADAPSILENPESMAVVIVVTVLIAAAGLLLTTFWLNRIDVD